MNEVVAVKEVNRILGIHRKVRQYSCQALYQTYMQAELAELTAGCTPI